MLHAGVLMILGGYGCFRIAIYLMPEAAREQAWIFLILTAIGVVYGAFAACVQKDLKYINAYSSVSHCSLVLFAILMMTRTAATGAILQFLSTRREAFLSAPSGITSIHWRKSVFDRTFFEYIVLRHLSVSFY